MGLWAPLMCVIFTLPGVRPERCAIGAEEDVRFIATQTVGSGDGGKGIRNIRLFREELG